MSIQIDYFTTKEKDITIEWHSQRQLPIEVFREKLYAGFPSFNVEILDENNNLLHIYENIPSSENFGVISRSSVEARREIIQRNPGFLWANPRKKEEFFKNKDIVKNSFTFPIEENVKIFENINGFTGYYKNLYIKITHNDSFQISYICSVSYENTDINILKSSLSKIYRSSDNLSLKLKLNPDLYLQSNCKSLLILTKASNNLELKPILIEDVQNKWLNTIDTSKIITIPFEETEIVETSDVLNTEIIPIENHKNYIVKSLINNPTGLNHFLQRFTNEKIISNNLYKNGIILEATSFQGYIYLFSDESYSNIAWPTDKVLINNVEFSNYFTLAKDSDGLDTVCLNTPIDVDTNLVNITLNQNINETIGYFNLNKDKFYDIKADLPYFNSKNIKLIKIKNLQKQNSEITMFLEFITNLTEKDDILINNISSNLNFVQKYYQLIDGINYLSLMFSIKYNANDNENLKNIIYDKQIINFSFRYNN